MIPNINKMSRLTKQELMQDTPVYQYTTVCKQEYRPEFSFSDMYSHDIPEISMVISGSGVHQILNQSIPCSAGDIYIINSDVPHGYFTLEGTEMTVRHLMFDPKDWFENDFAVYDHPRYCYGVFSENTITAYAMVSSKTREMIRLHLDAIAGEAAEKGHEWQEAIRAHLSLILISVGRYVNGAVKNILPAKSKEWGVVSTAMRMVTMNFDDCKLTLGSIADSLFISKSHLSRLFKQLTGEAFSDYLRNVRLQHACSLLKETEMTIEEIVAHCGLKDIPTFYRSFHNVMKMTPNQYRSQQCKSLSSFKDTGAVNELFMEISEYVQKGKANNVRDLVQHALDMGYEAELILNKGLLHGIYKIGEKFKNNEVYVPEVLVAARAMNNGTQILKHYISSNPNQSIGRVCIGTVQGDLHDIGKNLVKIMMESKGIEVIDLGTDVSPERFVEAAVHYQCSIICCSALLSTTMHVMEEVVNAAKAAGIRDRIKIMIGGAPTSEDFCHAIHADCYTEDAATAADMAVQLLHQMNGSLR